MKNHFKENLKILGIDTQEAFDLLVELTPEILEQKEEIVEFLTAIEPDVFQDLYLKQEPIDLIKVILRLKE